MRHCAIVSLAANTSLALVLSLLCTGKCLPDIHWPDCSILMWCYSISLHERSPVKGGPNESLSFAEQDLTVMKWSILWRTIILSALGQTSYPYCRHLRDLDLRDLSFLLDKLGETKFKGKVSKQFFAGPASRFHFLGETTAKSRAARLDVKRILLAVGDEITQHAPLLEGLSEPNISDVLITALPTWTPRLEHLRTLQFWDGKLLADETIRNLLHAHCPHLSRLQLYMSTNSDSDHHLALFISGLQANTLTSFENNSDCGIGPEMCLAMNSHGSSLTELKIGVEEEGMLALKLLKDCTMLETLHVTALRPSVDLKATQRDVYSEMVEWLKNCHGLNDVYFNGVISAPDLLLPVLNNTNVHLQTLQIVANKEDSMYVVKDHHDFHKALKQQPSLESLLLHAHPEPISRDDNEILMDAFSSLKNLTMLKLVRISDYFSNEHVVALAQDLPKLETLYVGGYGVSDGVLSSIAQMKHLREITFAGLTNFTVDGLLDFVDRLPESQSSLVLSVVSADPDTMITDEGEKLVRDALASKIDDGRFEYLPLRGTSLDYHSLHVD